MSWVAAGTAAVSIGSSLYSGSKAKKAAQKAAAAQAAAAKEASGIQSSAYTNAGSLQSNAAKQGAGILSKGYIDANNEYRGGFETANNTLNQGFNQASSYLNPYAQMGKQANSLLSKGLSDGSLTRAFGASDFQADPGYQFRQQQGMDGIQSSAAAGGGLLSGATLKALNTHNSNLASQEYQNAYNRFGNDQNNAYSRLMGATQLGMGASNNLSNMAYNNATNIAGNQTTLSQLLASGLLGSSNANAAGVTSSAGYEANALVNSANARAQGLYNAVGANTNGMIQSSKISNQTLADALQQGSQAAGAIYGHYQNKKTS
ncbi:hypothetical protein EXE30_06880 [Acinetobacter halotolerans]|uniref:DNA transfer protein p32 n=1 Tax=Acinetobacter halotolerans TaxID=1752076 RepID=A0A4Q6XJC3_9GAMM|nr:hypothetical protein [Acinetobacter halotolerans]RZF53694.1 hypothetical protein EXE30_06880 [Acinetobacter halotolerans]